MVKYEEMKLRGLISKGLTEQMELHDINQVDLAKILGVDKSTVGKWINQLATPSLGTIQKMADYFNVGKSYFLEEEPAEYYINNETKKIAQEIFDNKELRILFDAGRKASPEDLKLAQEILLRFKKNQGYEE